MGRFTDEEKTKRKKHRKKWNSTFKGIRSAMLSGSRRRAALHGLENNLEPSDIKIPVKCPILGMTLAKVPGEQAYCTPSLHRIDPKGGYTRCNIIVISWRANNLLKDATQEELQQILNFTDNPIQYDETREYHDLG